MNKIKTYNNPATLFQCFEPWRFMSFFKLLIVNCLFLILFTALPSFAQDATVCIGTKAVYAANGFPGSTFEYRLEQPHAGIIIQTHNDSIIVEWGDVKGIFQLGVRETSQFGCIGNWAFLNVEVVGEYAQFTQSAYNICSNAGVRVDFNRNDFLAWDWADSNVSPDGYITKPIFAVFYIELIRFHNYF